MKHYTSIEQSKKLLKLGLSAVSADLAWRNERLGDRIKCFTPSFDTTCANWDKDLPCWSLGALLEILPKNIRIVSTYYYYELYASTKGYAIDFIDTDKLRKLHTVEEESLIEAVYNMIVWLFENGYIKKGE